MTSQLLTLAGAVLAPWCLGAGIVTALGLPWHAGRRAFAAFALLAGQLALAPITFLWLATGKLAPGPWLPLGAALVGAALWWRHRRRAAAGTPWRRPDLGMFAVTLVCLALFADRCLQTNAVAITGGDEGQTWTAKARVLFAAPGFDLGVGLAAHTSNPEYPLLDPLVQVLAFATSDRLLPYESRLPIQAFGAALLLLLSAALSRRVSLPVGAALLLAVSGSTVMRWALPAMADVVLATALLAAAEAHSRFAADGSRTAFRLCCVALAAMPAIKNEGLLLVVLFGGAVLVAGRIGRDAATPRRPRLPHRERLWLLAPLLTWLLGRWFNAAHGLSPTLARTLTDPAQWPHLVAELPANAIVAARFYLGLLVAGEGRWLLLLALVATALSLPRLRRHPALEPAIVVAAAFVAYILAYASLAGDLAWNLAAGGERMLVHITPLATVVLAALLQPAPQSATAAASAPPP